MLANFEPLSFSIQWDQTTFFRNTFSNRGCARIMVIVNHIRKKVTPSYVDTYLVSSLVPF